MPTVPAPRILVVEDHATLRSQIVAVLEGAGWRVEEASDGRLALQMVLEEPPDVRTRCEQKVLRGCRTSAASSTEA
jgi:CheY-like chemotaxis protein